MTTKKLLTGAALLALGVTGGAAYDLTFARQARAQAAESTAEPKQGKSPDEGAKKGTDPKAPKQGAEGASGAPEGTAEPDTTGTRGESGKAGPTPMPDAAAEATEPEKKAAPQEATQPPESLKAPEGDSSKRDPIPPGSETKSPTQRQSPPW